MRPGRLVVLLALLVGCGGGRAPVFLAATRLSDTFDTRGPYPVSAMVIDDEGEPRVDVLFSVDRGATWERRRLERGADERWRGVLPGQRVGTVVHYYYEAVDGSGYLARWPAEGPGAPWEFRVRSFADLDGGPPPDAGPPDAGPADAGPPDAGPPDAGPPDAGPPDAGPPDDDIAVDLLTVTPPTVTLGERGVVLTFRVRNLCRRDANFIAVGFAVNLQDAASQGFTFVADPNNRRTLARCEEATWRYDVLLRSGLLPAPAGTHRISVRVDAYETPFPDPSSRLRYSPSPLPSVLLRIDPPAGDAGLLDGGAGDEYTVLGVTIEPGRVGAAQSAVLRLTVRNFDSRDIRSMVFTFVANGQPELTRAFFQFSPRESSLDLPRNREAAYTFDVEQRAPPGTYKIEVRVDAYDSVVPDPSRRLRYAPASLPSVTLVVEGIASCRDDGDCAPGQRCIANQCVAAPACNTVADCAPGQVCLNGECVQPSEVPPTPCQTRAECPSGLVCLFGTCVPESCRTDADCTAGQRCLSGECIPEDSPLPQGCRTDADCTMAEICIGGLCITRQCRVDADCGGGQTCFNGFCLPFDPPLDECETDRDCPRTQQCLLRVCVPRFLPLPESCQTPADCSLDPCEFACVLTICVRASCCTTADCPSGQTCAYGMCIPESTPAPGTCNAANPCPQGFRCVLGYCVPLSLPIPLPCGPGGTCPPGQSCVFGFCI